MVNANLGEELLSVAETLIPGINDGGGSIDPEPPQANLRRVTSTLYYAVFHSLAAHFANVLIGEAPTGGLEKAWAETYRALNHGGCGEACNKISGTTFSNDLQVLATEIRVLHDARIKADYEPRHILEMAEIHRYFSTARMCLKTLDKLPDKDMRALASWFLFHTPGSKMARKDHNTY